MLAAGKQPTRLVNCDLEEADLSNLDMTGWRFEDCILKRTNFTGATLDEVAFVSCRRAFVDFTAARLVEATIEKCDFNNGKFGGATVAQPGSPRREGPQGYSREEKANEICPAEPKSWTRERRKR